MYPKESHGGGDSRVTPYVRAYTSCGYKSSASLGETSGKLGQQGYSDTDLFRH